MPDAALTDLRDSLSQAVKQLVTERDAAGAGTAKAAAAQAEADRLLALLDNVQFAINSQLALDMNTIAARLLDSVQKQRAVGLSQATATLEGIIDQIRPVPPAAGQQPTPGPGSSPNFVLGALSTRFETGGRGSTTVSGGVGDPGGVSYGAYQMTSRPNSGTVAQFVSQPDFPFRNDFAGLIPGSAEFSAKWKDIATRFPDVFKDTEHEFIKRTHYDPLCTKIETDDGVDIAHCSHAMQDVIWSTAVQHGPNANIVHLAFGQMRAAGTFDPASPQFDRNAINAIYAERGRKDASGTLVHFSRSSPEVQNGVAKRFVEERTDALRMLDASA
jgi:hypothetical protein